MAQFSFRVLTVAVLFSACSASDYMEEQPNWLTPCDVNAEDLVVCATANLQSIFQHLSGEGLPGFTAFKTLDPFELGKIEVKENQNGPVNLKFACEKCQIYGFKNLIVKESKIVPTDHSTWLIKVFVPKMKLQGLYSIDGRILLVPLRGSGNMVLEFQDMTANVKVKNGVYEKYGQIFYNSTDVSLDYKIKGLRVRLDNLFNGNKELGDATNDVINENWRDMELALRPISNKIVKSLMINVFRSVFSFIPRDYYAFNIKDTE